MFIARSGEYHKLFVADLEKYKKKVVEAVT